MARPFDQQDPVLRRLGPPPSEARREVLLLPGAWLGPGCWRGLAQPLAEEGFGLNLLELPGHGDQPWELPSLTSLLDYALLAARAAGSLSRPVLMGHGLGGWLAQKILEVADLPAMLLAPLPGGGLPWPGMLALAGACPRGLWGLWRGQGLALTPGQARRLMGPEADLLGLCPEPALVVMQMLWGLPRARPPLGRSARLLVAGGRDRLVPAPCQARLAGRLGAGLRVLPGQGHLPWLGPAGGQVTALALKFLSACSDRPGPLS